MVMVVAMLAVVFFPAGCLLARELLRRERQRAEQREALRCEQEEELCGKLGHDDKQRSAPRPIPAPEEPRYRLEAFENGEWRRVHFFLETRDACYEVWREFVTDPEVENSWDAFRIVKVRYDNTAKKWVLDYIEPLPTVPPPPPTDPTLAAPPA